MQLALGCQVAPITICIFEPLFGAAVVTRQVLSNHKSKFSGDISWNFEKFLIDKEGKLQARFKPQVTPDDPALTAAIEEILE